MVVAVISEALSVLSSPVLMTLFGRLPRLGELAPAELERMLSIRDSISRRLLARLGVGETS